MLAAIESLPRFLTTVTVSKHRLFVWVEAPTLPDHQLFAFARDDDYFFGGASLPFSRGLGTRARHAGA
jgi:hypothetical protein